ncbi:MAG: hypothetical protein A2007_02500 [Verrucomicrobia bacterium GWC2_42_7]|nr:MAG: hypothetical protein A2007_02500 [Verrucomicrobia bacterium GWC2_42_7]
MSFQFFTGSEDEDELKKLEDKASYLYNLSPDIPEGSLDRPIIYRNPYYSVVFLARNPIEFQEKTCYTVAQEICSIIIRDDTTYDKDTFESDIKGVDIVIQESKKILSGTIQDPKNLLQKYRCDSLQTFLQKGHSCANHSIENNLISVVQSILCKGTGCESFSQNNLISKILAAVDKKDRNSLAISQILQAIDVEFDKLFRPLIPSPKEHIRDAIHESISPHINQTTIEQENPRSVVVGPYRCGIARPRFSP